MKAVACRGAGAALLQDIPKMVKMTEEVVKATHLPVTVKTRLGWDESTKNIVEVAERLQDIGIQALTVHGRTRVQMYKRRSELGTADRQDQRKSAYAHPHLWQYGDIDSQALKKQSIIKIVSVWMA